MSATPILKRPPTEREIIASRIAVRLDRPIGFLGILALALWLMDPTTTSRHTLDLGFELLGLLIAFAFVIEFAVRVVIAPSTWGFIRQHWWEIGLVALPFLRFLRGLRAMRAGRAITGVVRSSQHAGHRLRNRLFYLLLMTAVVGASGGRLLWEFGGRDYHHNYLKALHDAAQSTITGAQLDGRQPFAQVLELVLGIYSVVVIGSIAASLGAYFLEARPEPKSTFWWEPQPVLDDAAGRRRSERQ